MTVLHVIKTNLHPVLHHFEVIADYCSNLVGKMVTAFLSPLWGFGDNVLIKAH